MNAFYCRGLTAWQIRDEGPTPVIALREEWPWKRLRGTRTVLPCTLGRLFLYVKRNGWTGGVWRIFKGTLLYLPLLISLMQYAKGLRSGLEVTSVALIIALMICIGFLEEPLFRGFLFRGTLTRSRKSWRSGSRRLGDAHRSEAPTHRLWLEKIRRPRVTASMMLRLHRVSKT